MSRAFIKETDSGGDDMPERPVSSYPNDVTVEGLVLIETELARAQAAAAAAKAAGDVIGAAFAARDARYWSARRATAHVVPPPADRDHVRFGATVTIRRDDGRAQTWRIVGEDEADPARGTLSHAAPLARALFGKGVGDVVRIGAGAAEITALG